MYERPAEEKRVYEKCIIVYRSIWDGVGSLEHENISHECNTILVLTVEQNIQLGLQAFVSGVLQGLSMFPDLEKTQFMRRVSLNQKP